MARFRFYYQVVRDVDEGLEILEAPTKKEAKRIFEEDLDHYDLMMQAEAGDPQYFKVKVVQIEEVKS